MPSAPSAAASSSAALRAAGPRPSIWCSSSMIDSWVEAASAGAAPSAERTVAASRAARGVREVIGFRTPRARGSCGARARRGASASAGDRLVALGDLAPVDGVPPRVDVVGAPVLVLQVVGVLPDVNAQQRGLPLRDRVVLVGRSDDRQAGAVVDEPRPAGAELVDAGLLELGLEVVERAERGGDRVSQRTVGLAAAVRAHALPEQRVVVVPAAVVAHRL